MKHYVIIRLGIGDNPFLGLDFSVLAESLETAYAEAEATYRKVKGLNLLPCQVVARAPFQVVDNRGSTFEVVAREIPTSEAFLAAQA